ncbi:MAG: 4-hydroxy-tetrahydrodipicolinate reductase [Clostridia bacterium]
MKIVLNGAGGRMGVEVAHLLFDGFRNVSLAAAVDVTYVSDPSKKMFASLNEFDGSCDCIVDFSHHTATESLLNYAVKKHIPLVIATTSQTESEIDAIKQASAHVPIFFSANMSIGIALLAELAKQTVALFPDADVEIVESHHNQKLDVPSGTALLLANAIKEERKTAVFNVGRNQNGKRTADEIGIHSLRIGSEIGDHKIIVGTQTQTITLEHRAQSRVLFAEGAIAAACFVSDKADGLYNMKNIIKR